ncbi:MAG: hypothetical protein ACRCVJ_18820 [Clostridium sp.]|uniref:hypothetical protein n=1 Tax=Clostridium sp. TaxID=1506 RepID=UPI003F3BEE76
MKDKIKGFIRENENEGILITIEGTEMDIWGDQIHISNEGLYVKDNIVIKTKEITAVTEIFSGDGLSIETENDIIILEIM